MPKNLDKSCLRDRIEKQTGFEEKIKNNHIELLLEFKKRALNHEDHRVLTSVVLDACGM